MNNNEEFNIEDYINENGDLEIQLNPEIKTIEQLSEKLKEGKNKIIEEHEKKQIIEEISKTLMFQIKQIFAQYKLKKTIDLITNSIYLESSGLEKIKMQEKLDTDLKEFWFELKQSLRQEPSERVKKQTEIYMVRNQKLNSEINSLVEIIKPFYENRDFVKIRQEVFRYKRKFIKNIIELEKTDKFDNDFDLYYDDIFLILQNVKDHFKIDYFWKRIKR